MNGSWCASPYEYSRRRTREVRVGDVGIGGGNPIRVQSMTTPPTTNTEATVAQIIRLVEAGCEIVRITVPTSADARNLPVIRRELAARKTRVPLVADIHFSPGAALRAVEHVEKIRVNPGNYADRKQFAIREYTDAEYESELERLEETFRPLVLRAKQLGVAMRIGTNHGSLSDRILNRYGDTPAGMVESALEFVRICETHGYHDLVISMKSSNTVVTVEAYRLLAARMDQAGMAYPFHLGVTEAGDGVDGRVKSAIGIGALLDDGIGDTIRVSLTEDPVEEIPVARLLVEPYNRLLGSPGERRTLPAAPPADVPEAASRVIGSYPLPFDPFSHERRRARLVHFGTSGVGGEEPVRVEVRLRSPLADHDAIRQEIEAQGGPRVPAETRADLVEVEVSSEEDFPRVGELCESMERVTPGVALSAHLTPGLAADIADRLAARADRLAVRTDRDAPARAGAGPGRADAPPRALLEADRVVLPAVAFLSHVREGRLDPLDVPVGVGCPVLFEGDADSLLELLSFSSHRANGGAVALTIPAQALHHTYAAGDETRSAPRVGPVHAYRRLASGLSALGLDLPIVLSCDVRPGREKAADPSLILWASVLLGSLLCDGVGDAVSIQAADPSSARALAFTILQAARVRISKTEFISCPSCGRTLFDLEETTRRIKQRTAHLKGLKIAIMGCVVNGPGEMADADFGYVGWGAGKIALFVGKEMVERDIPTEEADDRLVALIKERGKWREPPFADGPAS